MRSGASLAGEAKNALCLLRPPGHHATDDRAMGFCLLNNIAVAARFAIKEQGLERVMIVDWDVHHGNGTQDIFWEDPQVGFLSMHRFPFYPGSGTADETGGGAGQGTTVNLPIRFGTLRQDQIKGFRAEVEKLADKMKPQLILISAGFDSHVNDPIGSLKLESEDFGELSRIVLDVAATHAGGKSRQPIGRRLQPGGVGRECRVSSGRTFENIVAGVQKRGRPQPTLIEVPPRGLFESLTQWFTGYEAGVVVQLAGGAGP